MRDLTIANIGAGSLYTPDFALMLIDLRERLRIREWRLMDIDPQRLEIVSEFVKKILDDQGIDVKIEVTLDLEEAVTGADYVFTTIRPGGAAGRVIDESIPQKYGFIGQETTAPGGLAMGLRNIPDIVAVARSIEKYADPNAWLINLTNPAGMLTEAIYRYSNCQTIGLCNWPISFWSKIAAGYGVERNDVYLQLVGLNHLNWARAFVKGRDVSADVGHVFAAEMAKKYGQEIVKDKFTLPKDIVDMVGWPLIVQYNRYYYMLDEMLANQAKPTDSRSRMMVENLRGKISDEILDEIDLTNVKTRAEFVEMIDHIALELYRQKSFAGFELIAGVRGGEGYGAAGLEIVLAMEENRNEIHVVDFPNRGSVPGLPDDVVLEHSCLVNAAGVFPISMPELKPHMHALVNAAKQYEILACESAMEGDYRKALEALIANPMINDFEKARKVLDDLLLSHKEYLPNFKEAINKIEQGIRPY